MKGKELIEQLQKLDSELTEYFHTSWYLEELTYINKEDIGNHWESEPRIDWIKMWVVLY